MGNAVFKMWANEKYRYKDGYALWLVARKDGKRKVIATGYYAKSHQWDDKNQIFVTDKRVADLHPDRKQLNDWLIRKKTEIIQILDEFEHNKIDWDAEPVRSGIVQQQAQRPRKGVLGTAYYDAPRYGASRQRAML